MTIPHDEDISDKFIDGTIVGVKCLQIPGFRHNQEHVDVLVRLGFKPTDSVYEITIRHNGGSKKHVTNILDLYPIAQHYDKHCPSKLNGCDIKFTISDGSIYNGFIDKISPR